MKTNDRLESLRRALELEHRYERERWNEQRNHVSRSERIRRGLACDDLEPSDETWGFAGRFVLTVGRDDREISSRLERGALVELRPLRDDEPVVTATIVRRRRRELALAFDRPPPDLFRAGRSFIELAPNTVSHRRALANIDAVARNDSGSARRQRDAWFGDAALRTTPGPNEPTPTLNPEQQNALEGALAARDLYAIHGPPGTGKSTVLAALMHRVSEQGSIIATAASNAAVDHLLELALKKGLRAVRVGHPARVADALQPHTLDVLLETHPEREVIDALRDEAAELKGYARRQRKRGRSRDRFGQATEARRDAQKLFREANERERVLAGAILDDAQVVCATLATLSGPLFERRTFALAVFDEATQSTEPMALAALLRANRVVLAGDPCQLPPTVLSPDAAKAGLAESALERLLRVHGEEAFTLLREQFRMHQAIMEFPSRWMYDGALRPHPSVGGHVLEGHPAPDAQCPMLYIDTAGKGFEEERDPDNESFFNSGELQLVVEYARRLLDGGLAVDALGVISPYAAQAARLRQSLPEAVEIDTVDAFQGREKDAILLSLVRSNARGEVGFLADERRLNVALTRARKHLAVFGDSATLTHLPMLEALIEESQNNEAYRSAWAWPA